MEQGVQDTHSSMETDTCPLLAGIYTELGLSKQPTAVNCQGLLLLPVTLNAFT